MPSISVSRAKRSAADRAHYQADQSYRERKLTRNKLWKQANPEKARKYSYRRWERMTSEQRAASVARARAWREVNPERYKQLSAEGYARRKANPDSKQRMYAHAKRRRRTAWGKARHAVQKIRRKRALRQQTPKWAAVSALVAWAVKCRKMRVQLRTALDIDHIYPLKGETVSGLNVPENLMILPSTINAKKGTRVPAKLLDWMPVLDEDAFRSMAELEVLREYV